MLTYFKSRKNVAKGPGITLIAADVAADVVSRLARSGDESVMPGDIDVQLWQSSV